MVFLTAGSNFFSTKPRFTAVIQLTNTLTLKGGLVTDGKTLYFGEERDGRIVISAISVEGGPVHTLSLSFTKSMPADISADGKSLLVLTREGTEVENALWIVSPDGGPPRRLGSVTCHAASWSPDGHRIAYAARNAIYLTNASGTASEELHAFQDVPEDIHWLPDGGGLRFRLADPNTRESSFWQLKLSSGHPARLLSLEPLLSSLKGWLQSTSLDQEARSFVSVWENGRSRILVLQGPSLFRTSRFSVASLNDMFALPGDLALDSRSKKLFVIGNPVGSQNDETTIRTDLIRYDPRSREFHPFLSGTGANYVDYSRDGRRIAYVRSWDRTLWVANADGSAARQIKMDAKDFELPRWSPDGRSIAVMVEQPGKPWRIFVVPADTGLPPREASDGTDGQGAPTWSPDGKWLAYGGVQCQERGDCAIHKIELATGRQFTVPGSEGLGTARWSGDGHSIAALSSEQHEVVLFDEKSQKWRVLATEVNGNDLAWSTDSRYLYASRPSGEQPRILRIAVKEGKTETAVDLSLFAKWFGRAGTWFTLASDNSIVFVRESGANEVFALTYAEH